jgi:hypothetical protein
MRFLFAGLYFDDIGRNHELTQEIYKELFGKATCPKSADGIATIHRLVMTSMNNLLWATTQIVACCTNLHDRLHGDDPEAEFADVDEACLSFAEACSHSFRSHHALDYQRELWFSAGFLEMGRSIDLSRSYREVLFPDGHDGVVIAYHREALTWCEDIRRRISLAVPHDRFGGPEVADATIETMRDNLLSRSVDRERLAKLVTNETMSAIAQLASLMRMEFVQTIRQLESLPELSTDVAAALSERPSQGSPVTITNDLLTESHRTLLRLVRESGRRMTTEEVLQALNTAGVVMGDSTAKFRLADLTRWKLLVNHRRGENPGYALPE